MANEPLGKLGVKLGLGNGILNRIGKISSRWNNREISSSPFLITLVNSRLLSIFSRIDKYYCSVDLRVMSFNFKKVHSRMDFIAVNTMLRVCH